MEAYLKQEMAGYCSTLRSMIEDNERCEKSGTSTEYEVERSKKIYRRLRIFCTRILILRRT